MFEEYWRSMQTVINQQEVVVDEKFEKKLREKTE